MNHITISATIRLIVAVISLLLLFIFVFPISRNIFTSGNAAGIALSALILGICVFWSRFRKLTSSLWQNTGGKAIIIIMLLTVVLVIVYAIIMSSRMLHEAHDYPEKKDVTLVVLGCKVKNGRPSLMLKKRLDAAYDFMAAAPEANAVLSGGKGDDEVISEAKCMYDYLCGRGISPDRLYMEDNSSTTYENLKFSQKIINENKLSDSIVIVTDGYHQYRAEMFAKRLGIHPANISADTTWWLVPTYWIRELIAIAYYSIK